MMRGEKQGAQGELTIGESSFLVSAGATETLPRDKGILILFSWRYSCQFSVGLPLHHHPCPPNPFATLKLWRKSHHQDLLSSQSTMYSQKDRLCYPLPKTSPKSSSLSPDSHPWMWLGFGGFHHNRFSKIVALEFCSRRYGSTVVRLQ